MLRIALAVLLFVAVCSASNHSMNATVSPVATTSVSASVAATTAEPETTPTSGVAEFTPTIFVLAMSAVFAAVARL